MTDPDEEMIATNPFLKPIACTFLCCASDGDNNVKQSPCQLHGGAWTLKSECVNYVDLWVDLWPDCDFAHANWARAAWARAVKHR